MHSSVTSTNIHQILRPDSFLMMLEMTATFPWIDLIFGLLEGWWLFDDGRRHVLVAPSVWESTLQSMGYVHVDWPEGAARDQYPADYHCAGVRPEIRAGTYDLPTCSELYN